jgi:hypothetical protein
LNLDQKPEFRVEDFPTESKWIDRLFNSLNPFISSVSEVFRNIDFNTNINSVTQNYSINGFQEISILWIFNSPPIDVSVVQAKGGQNLIPTVLLLAWDFNANDQKIKINSIHEVTATGVQALSGPYQFTIRASV